MWLQMNQRDALLLVNTFRIYTYAYEIQIPYPRKFNLWRHETRNLLIKTSTSYIDYNNILSMIII